MAAEERREGNVVGGKEMTENGSNVGRKSRRKKSLEQEEEEQEKALKSEEEDGESEPRGRRRKQHAKGTRRKVEGVMDNVGKEKKQMSHNRDKTKRAEKDGGLSGRDEAEKVQEKGNKRKQNKKEQRKGKQSTNEGKEEQGDNAEREFKRADVGIMGEHETAGKQGKVAASTTRSMFAHGFEERRDLEQYFWSERTVMQLKDALKPTAWHTQHGHVCCLAAPSLAHAFYATEQRIEALLDIDARFNYLPGFRFFDLCNPLGPKHADDFRIVIFDPPFFYIPLPVLFQAVLVAVHGNLQAKLLVGFLRREEKAFLQVFAPFRLRRTCFVLEYATVKPNKWRNYALYANIDLPGIKRIS